ncbi:MAG TPA: ATP synthase F1 subunit delta [Candidatus Angelobacter sp.]|jgi:F-type H+-transporting ATPase subunit delta|nr:ATP synthase F1 subunit delta [Candidatus Angelobacter sp.]
MAAVLGRYARAYADVVVKNKLNPEKIVAEFQQMADVVNSSRELRNVLQNPAVSREQKLKLLDSIIQHIGASKMLRNFLAVLIDNRRIGNVSDLLEQFKQELDRRMGIAHAKVTSVRELSSAERKSLEKELAEITGKTVRATYSEDASLLGGVLVRVGSTIYDGSVLGRLQRMRQEIAAG